MQAMDTLNEARNNLANCGLGSEKFVQIAGNIIPRSFIRSSKLTLLTSCALMEAYICLNIDADIATTLNIVVMLLTFSSGCLIYSSLIIKSMEIVTLFNYLDSVVNTRSQLCSNSSDIYHSRNKKISAIIQMVFRLAYMSIAAIHFIPALCPFLYAIIAYPSPELWIGPYALHNMSSFFGTNPVGFTLMIIISCSMGLAYMSTFKAFTTIYVSISTNIRCFVDDITLNVARLNETIEKHGTSNQSRILGFIDLHKHCYRLIEILEDIIRVPIFLQTAVFVLQFSICLFELEMSITSFSFNLITFLSGLFAVLTWNYLLSYFLTTLTLNAMSIGYCVYGLHWYQMSCNEQIMVQMIIRRSQKPFELKGLGLFACSLETYLKMIRTALSCYMVFRQL